MNDSGETRAPASRWSRSPNARPTNSLVSSSAGTRSTRPARVAKRSAGLVMYRRAGDALEVLLVHPGGPFWAKRDAGAWSIPKGECESGEEPLAAAIREFREETGLAATPPYLALTPIRQRSGKIVTAWAFEGDCDPASLTSATVSLEWPRRSGRHLEFPEIDRAGWFGLEEARRRILPAQAPLLDELQARRQRPTP